MEYGWEDVTALRIYSLTQLTLTNVLKTMQTLFLEINELLCESPQQGKLLVFNACIEVAYSVVNTELN